MSMDQQKVIPRTAKRTIEIIYAGGTISSFATAEAYREGGHDMDLLEELSLRTPGFDEMFNIGGKETAYLGLSENIDFDSWQDIENKAIAALERNAGGVLITHGTDSMEQTARRLNKKLHNLLVQKKARIIMTGAKDDISMSKTDAWDNLMFGLECASSSAEPGVYVAFHGKLIAADKVVKKPVDYEHGVAMIYIANDDPEYFAALQKQKEDNQTIIAKMVAAYETDQSADRIMEYDVNIVRPNHNKFLDYIASHSVRAVVLNLYHTGTANTENPNMDIAKMVNKLRKDKGIVFFGVTENGEPVDLHAYETSVKMRHAGVVPLYDMPRTVGLAKLGLIDPTTKGAELVQEMLKNKVGEIDETRIIADDFGALIKLYR